MPPKSEYLEPEDQPARTIPYTPSDVTAKINNNAMGKSEMTPWDDFGKNPKRLNSDVKGITAKTIIAGTNEIIGASANVIRSTLSGTTSSLNISLTPSARG